MKRTNNICCTKKLNDTYEDVDKCEQWEVDKNHVKNRNEARIHTDKMQKLVTFKVFRASGLLKEISIKSVSIRN